MPNLMTIPFGGGWVNFYVQTFIIAHMTVGAVLQLYQIDNHRGHFSRLFCGLAADSLNIGWANRQCISDDTSKDMLAVKSLFHHHASVFAFGWWTGTTAVHLIVWLGKRLFHSAVSEGSKDATAPNRADHASKSAETGRGPTQPTSRSRLRTIITFNMPTINAWLSFYAKIFIIINILAFALFELVKMYNYHVGLGKLLCSRNDSECITKTQALLIQYFELPIIRQMLYAKASLFALAVCNGATMFYVGIRIGERLFPAAFSTGATEMDRVQNTLEQKTLECEEKAVVGLV